MNREDFLEIKEGQLIKAGINYYRVSIVMKRCGGGDGSKYEKAHLKKISYKELLKLDALGGGSE